MIDPTHVFDAEDSIRPTVRETPIVHSRALSASVDAEIHLKLENLQRTGSFKIRGATNYVTTHLETLQETGVITASSGNHAQGVAFAANRYDLEATIVMPESTPRSKVEATESYGASIVLSGDDYGAAKERAYEIRDRDGATYVPTFDDWTVIAGQGTLGLEVLRTRPDCDVLVVPIGGGGLISGISLLVKGLNPSVRIVGVQADGASTIARSLEKGQATTLDSVDTVADGIAINSPGTKPLSVIESHVDEVVTVDDDAIEHALARLLETDKVVVEGAGAAPVAALLSGAIDVEGEVVVPVLSGGNIDLDVVGDIVQAELDRR
ncbi:threonine ammonia-lyase [Natrinema halophilum]|uniref:threonine ammonia-lyase n=1 Tax=Natrinema halophilum TaxID=1699371 RepID=A0A7D5GIL7_9EURY|nr:threonine ammonia-lyase [Natrinema halophilum]QLG49994.1 threonine ammonia-lyase [Natrinema halophilum]